MYVCVIHISYYYIKSYYIYTSVQDKYLETSFLSTSTAPENEPPDLPMKTWDFLAPPP